MSIIDMDNRDKDEVLRMREAEIEVMKAEFRRRVEGWRGGLASDCVAAVYDSMTAYLDSADKPAKYQPPERSAALHELARRAANASGEPDIDGLAQWIASDQTETVTISDGEDPGLRAGDLGL